MTLVDGDSIVVNKLEKSWPGLLGFGCLGANDSTVLEGLKRIPEVLGRGAKRYYGMFGTWSAWRPGEVYEEPLGLFALRLHTLVGELAGRGVAVVLVTPPARVMEKPYNLDIERYADVIRAVAAGRGCGLLDVQARMRLDSVLGYDITRWMEEGDKHNHLTLEGHERVAWYAREGLCATN